jgi:hypothetical protein
MNHLEQLVGEWLQYNGYFVRTSVLVGRGRRGGYMGELDVVGVNLAQNHFLHVECSLDALSDEKKQAMFSRKFKTGRDYAGEVIHGVEFAEGQLEQAAVLQVTGTNARTVGGVRAITVRDLIHEITGVLSTKSPMRAAVPSVYPLLRTLQLAADANPAPQSTNRLLKTCAGRPDCG